MKRLLLVVFVAAMLVLAGCAESIDTSDDDPSADPDGDPDTDGNDTDGNDTDDTEPETDASPPDGDLEIHHIDVGQADATLLIEPSGETMLVDSGDWPQGGSGVIEYLEDQDVDRIDHLVATHGHADHVGGHDGVIEHFETEREGIGTAYDSGVAATSQTYERYLDAIEAHEVDLVTVEDGDSFEFGDADVSVFNPPAGDSGDDVDYNSVALSIAFGDFTYLTTGDAGESAEQRMVDDRESDLEATAYQAGHHGSSTSSTAPFVERVSPEVAIISSDYDSQYGHPHDEVLETYAAQGIETYWTGVHGTVVLTTDGEDYDLETDREFSTDPEDLLAEKPDESQAALDPLIDVAGGPLVG